MALDSSSLQLQLVEKAHSQSTSTADQFGPYRQTGQWQFNSVQPQCLQYGGQEVLWVDYNIPAMWYEQGHVQHWWDVVQPYTIQQRVTVGQRGQNCREAIVHTTRKIGCIAADIGRYSTTHNTGRYSTTTLEAATHTQVNDFRGSGNSLHFWRRSILERSSEKHSEEAEGHSSATMAVSGKTGTIQFRAKLATKFNCW